MGAAVRVLALVTCAAMLGCAGEAPAEVGATEPLVGHYRLVGQMETASELVLHEGGRFDYSLSVGSLDAHRSGTWSVDPYTQQVSLRTQGSDARVARALSVVRVERMAELIGALPADHPLQHASAGVAVRIESSTDDEAASALILAAGADQVQMDGVDLVDGRVRWNIFDAPPASMLLVGGPSADLQLQQALDVPQPGGVIVVRLDYGQLVDAQGLPVMWQFQQADDGSLVPVSGIDDDDGRPVARYVPVAGDAP